MILKMQQFNEVPFGTPVLAVRSDGEYAAFKSNGAGGLGPDWIGCYVIADLLRAAEILAAITPEGYEYTGEVRRPNDGDLIFPYGEVVEVDVPENFSMRYLILRRIAPAVEYRYEAEHAMRVPKPDDWVWCASRWLSYEEWLRDQVRPFKMDQDNTLALCARRVEVKR